MRETTNLCLEVMNSKRQVKRKLGHVVQISESSCLVFSTYTRELKVIFCRGRGGGHRFVVYYTRSAHDLKKTVSVVVQFYPWFKFSILFFLFFLAGGRGGGGGGVW